MREARLVVEEMVVVGKEEVAVGAPPLVLLVPFHDVVDPVNVRVLLADEEDVVVGMAVVVVFPPVVVVALPVEMWAPVVELVLTTGMGAQ